MYQVINDLPIDLNFFPKTKDEIKLYADWFYESKHNRIMQLAILVTSDPDFKDWRADYSPESLKQLGQWLSNHIEMFELNEVEYKIKKAKYADWVEVPNSDLTLKARSFLLDSGIYFGEVFIKHHENLKWKQFFSKIKKDVDHGHMCITLKKRVLNPIWILYILGYSLADKSKDGDRLYELYKIWETFV